MSRRRLTDKERREAKEKRNAVALARYYEKRSLLIKGNNPEHPFKVAQKGTYKPGWWASLPEEQRERRRQAKREWNARNKERIIHEWKVWATANNYKNGPKSKAARQRNWQSKKERLSGCFVRKIISRATGIPTHLIPEDFEQLVRLRMKIRRKLNQPTQPK